MNATPTAAEIASNAATTHMQLRAAGLFTSGTSMAYMLEGLLAAVALVVGTIATLGKASKEGAGAGMTHSECRVHTEAGVLLASFTVDAMVRPFPPDGRTRDERRAL